jgi:hypothetical protein
MPTDFNAMQCGESVPNYKMKMRLQTKQFAFSGGFVKDCNECVVTTVSGIPLFPDYICPDDPYSLSATYGEKFGGDSVEYKAG